jgi:hypothetical protein
MSPLGQKAHTSPDKKPVIRREELNRQYEKLKNNLIAVSSVPN